MSINNYSLTHLVSNFCILEKSASCLKKKLGVCHWDFLPIPQGKTVPAFGICGKVCALSWTTKLGLKHRTCQLETPPLISKFTLFITLYPVTLLLHIIWHNYEQVLSSVCIQQTLKTFSLIQRKLLVLKIKDQVLMDCSDQFADGLNL